jgi:uncharacterized protein YecT (DUF1311 family)
MPSPFLRSFGAIAALLAIAAATVRAQDEEKEPTLAEAKAALAKADRELNDAWKKAKAAVDGSDLARLTLSQREWIEFRDARAKEDSERAGHKDIKRSPLYFSTAAAFTETRAEWLRGRARPADETLTGYWIDSYGGTLRIVQQEQRLFFDIEVVRGPTFHSGGIAGVAFWNSRLGWFSDKGRDPEKTEESNLAFIDRGGELEIVGAETQHYHGARAYFDGNYVKVGPLDADVQAKLIKTAESGEMPEPSE